MPIKSQQRRTTKNRIAKYLVDDIVQGVAKATQTTQKANIAQCCDSFIDVQVLGRKGNVSETTYSSDIAFARQMLPTIPALLPSLVAEEVSIVQAIDRPQAQRN